MRQPLGERQLELAVHGGQPQRHVLDRLHEHAAALGPAIDGVSEQMAGQAIDLTQVAMLVDRLGMHVVRRQMVAPGHDQAAKVALLTGHPMQRLDVRRDRNERHEIGIRVKQQLTPGSFNRHRVDVATVAREPTALDQPAVCQ